MMITGDYGLTAESIAQRIGIIRGPQPRLLTGPELATMDDEALKAALQAELQSIAKTTERLSGNDRITA
jgi:magnesium-transporting ATPase (P-type)